MESKDVKIKIGDLEKDIVVEDAGIEYTDQDDLKDIQATDENVAAIIDRLNSEDWKENFYGVDDLRSLYKHHPEGFRTYLPKYQNHIVEDVENLRSSISRNSLNLVVEVFSTHKNLSEKDENGDITPYASFACEVLPIVCKRLADDKAFISSKAKTATELISKHCVSKQITERLCELTRSKSLVISSEANHALKANIIVMESEHCKDKDNMQKLLTVISEDLNTKRQPFSKNAKLILKELKEKLGEPGLESVAREALEDEAEVK